MQTIRDKKDVMKLPVVKKASIPDTLALIPHGKVARYVVQDMKLSSLRAQISLINKRAGRKEFEITVYNNGEYFDVKHN